MKIRLKQRKSEKVFNSFLIIYKPKLVFLTTFETRFTNLNNEQKIELKPMSFSYQILCQVFLSFHQIDDCNVENDLASHNPSTTILYSWSQLRENYDH